MLRCKKGRKSYSEREIPFWSNTFWGGGGLTVGLWNKNYIPIIPLYRENPVRMKIPCVGIWLVDTFKSCPPIGWNTTFFWLALTIQEFFLLVGGHKTKSENCESINKCNFSSNRIIVKGIYIALILMWTQISALSAVGGGRGERHLALIPDRPSILI